MVNNLFSKQDKNTPIVGCVKKMKLPLICDNKKLATKKQPYVAKKPNGNFNVWAAFCRYSISQQTPKLGFRLSTIRSVYGK